MRIRKFICSNELGDQVMAMKGVKIVEFRDKKWSDKVVTMKSWGAREVTKTWGRPGGGDSGERGVTRGAWARDDWGVGRESCQVAVQGLGHERRVGGGAGGRVRRGYGEGGAGGGGRAWDQGQRLTTWQAGGLQGSRRGTVASLRGRRGGSISSDSFLPSILLLVVIIVTVVIVVVILIVVVVAIVGVVIVVAIIGVVVVVGGVFSILKLSFVIIGFLGKIMFYHLLHQPLGYGNGFLQSLRL
ncbi:hypothetical protein Tco_1538953 [Tanacetum coccineum]